MINFIVCDYVENNLWMYLIQARKQVIHTYRMMKRKKQNKQQTQKKLLYTFIFFKINPYLKYEKKGTFTELKYYSVLNNFLNKIK